MCVTRSAVKNSYRFTQLGVGWVLRDVSVHHPTVVIDFLNKHEEDFTKEAVRYATEKMTPTQKKQVNRCTKRLCVCSLRGEYESGFDSLSQLKRGLYRKALNGDFR